MIHGAPSRFTDPARFAFAHGGKGGAPFPVPTAVYDETIGVLRTAVARARIGEADTAKAVRALSRLARRAEDGYTPRDFYADAVARENREAHRHGGRTVGGFARPHEPTPGDQLGLFGA